MKSISGIVAAVVLPLLLAACDKSPSPPLVFGANLWPGYEPVYLARELGYFSAINLRLAEYNSAAEVQQAFRKHELQLAAVTIEDAIQLSRDIPDLKIVLLLGSSHGADAILSRPGIDGMRQLQGLRVGVDNSLRGAYFLSLALKNAGMQPGQVEIVPLPVNGQELAMRAQKVDAVVVSGPARENLQENGLHELFSSTRLSGKMFDVLIARDEDMGRFHNEMMEWVQTWNRSLDFIHTQPDKAMQIMAKHEHMDVARFSKALKDVELLGMQRNLDLLSGEQPAVGGGVDSIQRYLLGRGLINMGADAAMLLDTSLLSKVSP